MAKSIDDLYREMQKLSKEVIAIQGQAKELSEIKRILRGLDLKIQQMASKIQEFEVIMDAAELLEDHMNDHDDEDNEGWNPYGDSYEAEEYEDYNSDEDEEDN